MDRPEIHTLHIDTIAQHHQISGVGKPIHPLFSILRFEDFSSQTIDRKIRFTSGLYQVTLKKDCPCSMKYGQTHYDFDEGIMSFFSPNQIQTLEPGDWLPDSGWIILIHPDFLRGYPLSQKIKSYGFFDYAMNEALILSDEEEKSIELILLQMEKEAHLPIDNFSQQVIVSNLDLLLTYCDRYYNRQFIVRKPGNSELVSKVTALLNDHFNSAEPERGLPTALFLAGQLNLSSKYLNDCLKQLTGLTTQQLIHEILIERAKEVLTSTSLSVSEIAYLLGFEYPQSFSKLFKNKTSQTPLAYRQSFN